MRFRLTKEEKKIIIDYLENYCINTRFSLGTVGLLLRAFHYNFPFISLYILCYQSNFFVIITLFLLFLAYISWIPFNCCFLSMLENRICKDNFNIADPFLELFYLKITKSNRLYMSYFVGGMYLNIVFAILFFRYFYPHL